MAVSVSHKRRLELIQELEVLDYHLGLSESDEWDIYNIKCSGCGAVRWSKGKVGKKNKIIKCDLCPIEDNVH